MEARLRFVDLFAGLGGFRLALGAQGLECVFACELDGELRDLYSLNFPDMRRRTYGDIKTVKFEIPEHEVLCAGFPCQPFSKSGEQRGFWDRERGGLLDDVLDIVESREPRWVILENVGNFPQHDDGLTWRWLRSRLESLGYQVRATEPAMRWRDASSTDSRSGGISAAPEGLFSRLLSPHHLGFPQVRERFYVVASRHPLPEDEALRPFRRLGLAGIVQARSELSPLDRSETSLSPRQIACIEHWNRLLKTLPAHLELPRGPLWGDEIGASYPFEGLTPWASSAAVLRRSVRSNAPAGRTKAELLDLLPSYARTSVRRFPTWKIDFIRENRKWWSRVRPLLPKGWAEALLEFPPSWRKLEFNARGGQRDLWRYVLQFRPSGLRAKRYSATPALVAMTDTQRPVLGPERRFLSRVEALRLQGFPDDFRLPEKRDRAFAALGNAVHVGVVSTIVTYLLADVGRSRARVA